MTFEEIRAVVLELNESDQKRLVMEVILKEVLPKICPDEECTTMIRSFVDDITTKAYREQHMDGI